MRFSFILIFFVYILPGCRLDEKAKKPIAGPAGYDWENPVKINLPEELDEISGIVFNPADSSIVSLNDEEGILYSFRPEKPNLLHDSRFHKGADFEELISVRPYWYAMKSNGNLYRITNAFADNTDAETYPFHLTGKNEFEAMLYDSSNNRILLFCKVCQKTPSASPDVYSFNLASSTFDSIPAFQITLTETQKKELPQAHQLQISGAAIHPYNGKWYLICSVSGVLIITDNKGVCQEIYNLKRKIFKQPEGICFATNGDLFISNEAKTGIANVLYYKYNPRND